MIICPECREPLEDSQCVNGLCSWELKYFGGIPNYLNNKDIRNFDTDGYITNYETLANKNIVQSNIDPTYHQYQAENIIRYVGVSNIKNRNVCDVGSGQGQLAKLLVKAGAKNVTCIDISPTYLAELPQDPKIIPVLANAENLPFNEAFDIIVATDVLEHTIHVSSFLYCLNMAVIPGGMAVIRVPYRENIIKYSTHLGFEYSYGHLRNFNRKLLRDMMQGIGFKPVKWKIDGFGLGMIHEFWLKEGSLRRELVVKFRKFLLSYLDDPISVTKWHSFYARLLMRPNELVVIARKIAKLEKSGKSRVNLTRFKSMPKKRRFLSEN